MRARAKYTVVVRLLVLAFFWGVLGGYLTLAAGPIAGVLVLAALVLGLRALRGQPAHVGTFMVGAGISGTAILGRVLLEAWKCDYQPCTSVLTFPTFALFAVISVAGLALLLLPLARRRGRR